MARVLDRIWVRFGLSIVATVFVTIGLLWATIFIYTQYEYDRFYNNLPVNVRQEMDQLEAQDQDNSPRMIEIYSQYWRGDPWDGEQLALVLGLVFCLPFGLIAGLWTSRLVTLPVGSIAEAANRIALGDFSVRAHSKSQRGELADLVRDFNHMTDSLESLEHERKATAAAISHELRTPIAILQARLHALCDGVIPAEPLEFQKLLEQAEHLGRLVDDLHTLSVADAGRLSLHMVTVDLAEVARDTLGKYASRLDSYGIEAELAVEAPDLTVKADEDRLRQILNNLIENALRYAREGGWLELRLSTHAEQAVIVLSDAGPGLPDVIKANLFKRFQRADASRNRASGGTGLGLAIVKTLTVLQGGRIEAGESARGGAQFRIYLPLSRV
ncbi:sensor histidine kinase [Pseudomonas luteola]|uniref:sensor histidine kinase n=1 Tax=Pseudomonas luteola TaxID=47886 RepID=UPI00123B54A8|nr:MULTISPECIES: ATP-binding protein [Pseudomonas]MBA1250728.1 HAMP domain-containing protein [Pseudomonas zeshuii]QEU30810.1 HAMP domain-containing protein [Pseudomonas luteola]